MQLNPQKLGLCVASRTIQPLLGTFSVCTFRLTVLLNLPMNL